MNESRALFRHWDELRPLLHESFHGKGALAAKIRANCEYCFEPTVDMVEHDAIIYRLTLNESRARYVHETSSQFAQSQLAWSNSIDRSMNGFDTAKFLCEREQHQVPPGYDRCPFDAIEDNALFLGRFEFDGRCYAAIGNKRPWGHEHFLLVSAEARGQAITAGDLCVSFHALRRLGHDYEATFAGVLAGASILHMHVQFHKGAAAIWENLELGRLRVRSILSTDALSIFENINWPAAFRLYRGTHDAAIAEIIVRTINENRKSRRPYAYNLGMKLLGDEIAVFLFPRSTISERPIGLNEYPLSWGRYSFNEMGGSIVFLSLDGFEATVNKPQLIAPTLKQMSGVC